MALHSLRYRSPDQQDEVRETEAGLIIYEGPRTDSMSGS